MDYAPIEGVDWLANYYAVLGVSRDSTPREISRAYRETIRGIHPDDLSRADELLVQAADFIRGPVQKAYETLKDEERRAVYDRLLDEFLETKPQCISESGFPIKIPDLFVHIDALVANQTLDASRLSERVLETTGYDETVFSVVESAYRADPENPELKRVYRRVLLQKEEYLDVLQEVAWLKAGVANSSALEVNWDGTSQGYLKTLDELVAQTRDTVVGAVDGRVKALTTGLAPKLLTAEGDVYEPQDVEGNEIELRKTLTDAALTTYDDNVEAIREVAAQQGEVMEKIVALADWQYYPRDQPLTDRLLVVIAMDGLIDSTRLYDSFQEPRADSSHFIGLSVEDFKESPDIDTLVLEGTTISLLTGTPRLFGFEAEYVAKQHREKLGNEE